MERTSQSVRRTKVSAVHKLLGLLVLLGLPFATIPVSFAADELVVNGGFETGKLNGWTAANTQVLKSTSSVPAHSGSYSARIGTATTQGGISQTVSIPAKSSARFTAWYRVEKSSSLTISLKRSDGSEIQRWTASSMSMWTSVTYDLDVSNAGKPVTIEIAGVGYRESTIVMITCTAFDPVTGLWYTYACPMETYKNYYSYVDDISLTYTIAIYETTITVSGLPQGLSTQLIVDGTQVTTTASSQSKTLSFKIGETHSISVDPYVYRNNSTRYYCSSNSATVSSDKSITFSYTPEYYLSVTSPHGNATGSGWYPQNSEASFSIDRIASPIQDYTGTLGAKYVFVKWVGDSSDSSPNGRIVMDGPKAISAVWAVDNSLFYASIAIMVSAVVGGVGLTYRFATRRKTPLKLPFKPPIEVPVEEILGAAGAVTMTADPKEQEVLNLLDRLEKSREDGTVTEKAYQKLREDYEKRLAEIRASRSENP